MKKFLLLFVSIAIFTSCSNDDDVNNDVEPILGTWVLVDVVNPVSDDEYMNDCTAQSTIEFRADNTAESNFYNGTEDACVSETNSSTWSRTGNSNTYTIDIPVLGPQSGTVTFSGNRFTFANPIGFQATFERQ